MHIRLLRLGGKKDYTIEYIDYLMSKELKNEALVELTKVSIHNPNFFDRLRDLFSQLHPQDDFKKYWNENVDNILPVANAFQLHDLNGIEVSLSQYKGKWLLLDFWGTWCSPCLDELPSIQKLYDEMNEKHPEKVSHQLH